MSEENIKQNERQEGFQVYELGFHFVPTLSEDEAMVKFSHLKSLVEKKGGTFISEETPHMINLAYEISKTVKAQKKHYSSSYFGWVKFEIDAEKIASLEKEVKDFEPVLRYLIIKTVRENTLHIPRDAKGDVKKTSKEDISTEGSNSDTDASSSENQATDVDSSQDDQLTEDLVQE
jgi:ribosomal protein S6